MVESTGMVALWTVLSLLTLVFPLTYMMIAAWYKSTVGRMLMCWSLAYSLHVIASSVVYFYDHEDLFVFVRTLSISCVAVFSLLAAATMIYMNHYKSNGGTNE